MTPMDTKPLSPSERKSLTRPQANKLGEAFTAALLKANPFSDEAQDLIENSWDQIRDEVEAASVEAINRVLDRKRNTITIRVRVKRGRTGRQVFADTGRVQYVTGNVADSAPLIPGDGYEEVDFVFFKAGRRLKDSEVEEERRKRGLVRDLEAQAEANLLRPEFADEHWNGDSTVISTTGVMSTSTGASVAGVTAIGSAASPASCPWSLRLWALLDFWVFWTLGALFRSLSG